jgi:hypothetical protein
MNLMHTKKQHPKVNPRCGAESKLEKVFHAGYVSGMWKMNFFVILSSFLLDILHARVHVQGFRNQLASFGTQIVVIETAQQPETGEK